MLVGAVTCMSKAPLKTQKSGFDDYDFFCGPSAQLERSSGQTDKQADGRTDRQTDRQTDREIER